MTINPYRPYVTIDGRRLPDGLNVSDLSPIASINIRWGADDWYTDVEPAVLTIEIIDPAGDLLDIDPDADIPIVVTRDDPWSGPDSKLVFEGNIQGVSAVFEPRVNPATGERFNAWTVRLTAVDPLGALKSDRRHGQTYPARELTEKRLHWGPCLLEERMADLDARTVHPISWPTANWPYGTPPVNGFYPIASYETQQNISVLTVLRNTARIVHILARPYFFPSNRTIGFPEPILGSFLPALNPAAELVDNPNDTASRMVAAVNFGLTGAVEVGSTVSEQVNRIERTARFEKSAPPRLEIEEVTSERTVGSGAQTTFQYTTDWSAKHPGQEVGTGEVQSIFGMYRMQPLEWKPRPDSEQGFADLLLTPEPPLDWVGTGNPSFLRFFPVGAITHWSHRSAGFAVVGGELSYTERGWKAILHPAPVPVWPFPPTLGDLTQTVELKDIPERVTLGDLTKTRLII